MSSPGCGETTHAGTRSFSESTRVESTVVTTVLYYSVTERYQGLVNVVSSMTHICIYISLPLHVHFDNRLSRGWVLRNRCLTVFPYPIVHIAVGEEGVDVLYTLQRLPVILALKALVNSAQIHRIFNNCIIILKGDRDTGMDPPPRPTR